MQKFKKLAVCLTVALLLVCCMSVTAFAATGSQDGLTVEIKTDKETYSATEEIKVDIEVTNTNDFTVENVSIEGFLPEGLKSKSGELTKTVASLEAGQKLTVSAVAIAENTENKSNPGNTDSTTPTENIPTQKDGGNPKTGDSSNAVLWLVLALVSAAGMFLTFKYRKKASRILSLVLCICLLAGTIGVANFTSFAAAGASSASFEVNKTIIVDGKNYTIKAVVSYASYESDDITIDTSSFVCIDETKSAYLVDSKVDSISGTALGKISKLEVRVEYSGFVISTQELTPAKNWKMENPPLLVGENNFSVIATTTAGTILKKSIILQCNTNENESYANLDLDDDDGDGLLNWLEDIYGTDKNNPDTDGDGLSDYEEVFITYTNPLVVDTDGNGISDADEDFDNDGLNNLLECKYGTSPYNADTDGDGISDYDEINVTKTDPTKYDTDGDGAGDDWEIENGYDPLVFNAAFTVKEETAEISNENPVSASVQIQLSGNQIDSLDIEVVTSAQNPLISTSIPGFLGDAYDFYVEGTFSSAQLEFKYDTSLGNIGDSFQPRIYYFNEEFGTLEELPNQTVINGCVTTTINHFSVYILLNKVAFDEVWEVDIKQPLEGSDEQALDIVFVIDYSASMEWNDPSGICKEVTKSFIGKLNENDRAAIVTFIAAANTLIGLTNDKSALVNAVNGIYWDDGYGWNSGTNGSAGLKLALDALNNSGRSAHKFIVFLTDGEENSVSYSYSSLIAEAKNNDISIFTVGLGDTLSHSLLEQVANETGGKYYHATVAGELVDGFDLIIGETVDLVTDSNNDGIPDYYNDLIMNGDLRLSNGSDEFMGINFNDNADYDGDGLLNGEELKIVTQGNKVYLLMVSDPLMKHSDGDGIDDYRETRNGTDPLRYSFSQYYADALKNDSYYYYAAKVDHFNDSFGFQLTQAVNATIYGLWNPGELFRDQIISYFYYYSGDEYINQITHENARIAAIDNLAKGNSNIIKSLKDIKYVAGNLAKNADYLPAIQELAALTKESKEMISRINALIPTDDYSNLTRLLDNEYLTLLKKIDALDSTVTGKVQFKINGIAKKYTDFMGQKVGNSNIKVGTAISIGLDVINTGVDIADTVTAFSKVNANSAAFERNYDILLKLKTSGNRQFTIDAAQTVINAMGKGYGSYGEELAKAIAADTAEGCINIVISIAAQNPYVGAVKMVRDGIALITGIKNDLKQMYEMICIYDMTQATSRLFVTSVKREGSYYSSLDVNPSDTIRYLTHMAQMRIIGEKKYIDFMKYDGVLGWFISNDKVEKEVNDNIAQIKQYAKSLDLQIAKSLQ